MADNIVFDSKDHIAIISLNRPDKLNAFNDAMHKNLAQALDKVESDKNIRVLILTGQGRGFCAGQDLGDRNPSETKTDLGETVERFYNPLITKLHNMRVPVICAVNGVAAGAGANIALACDIVIAASTAKFVEVFTNIGLLPDSGGTYHLPRHIGLARALGLALIGEPVMAKKAKKWGLIWEVCAPEDLMKEAYALADKLAQKPPLGLELTKKALRESFNNDLTAQLEIERRGMQKAGFSDDYAEAVSAFLQKRKPVFKGK